jgi:hypothetical protein
VLFALALPCLRAETLLRLQLPNEHSPLAIREMQAELGRVVEAAELDLEWVSAEAEPRAVNGPTISIAVNGRCLARGAGRREDGPLGWTKTINDTVLPFVEIACNRVEGLLEPAWTSESGTRRELLLGRALGRVLAHELAHALTRTKHHSGEGLRKRALSPRDLLTGEYRLAQSDFRREAPTVQAASASEPQVERRQPVAGDFAGR